MAKLHKFSIDPRTKIIHILMAIITFLVINDPIGIILIVVGNCVLLMIFGYYKSALGYLSYIVVVACFNYNYHFEKSTEIINSVSTFLALTTVFLPALSAGSIFSKTTQVTDMITAFRKMKLPYAFVITFAVTMRFMPTIKYEFNYIKNSMKIRGIRLSLISLVIHPVRTIEYILVPLIFRSGKVADELSESALTRAIEYPGERTSLNDIVMGKQDILYLLWISMIFIGGMLWNR